MRCLLCGVSAPLAVPDKLRPVARRALAGASYAAMIALSCIATALAQAASSGIHVVTDFGDDGAPGQLRTLIDAAAPGDTIVIPPGTLSLRGAAGDDLNKSGDLDIDKDLTIIGAGAGRTVLDGSGIDRVLDVLAPAQVGISGVTIQNGSDPLDFGGGISNGGTLILSNAAIVGNLRGGGLYNFGIATLTDVTIRGNAAAGSGGGIYNSHQLALERVTISGNSAGAAGFQSGGGIFSVGPVTFINVTISGNTAAGLGGGIFKLANTATLTNVTIADNTAAGEGAGVFNASATMELKNVVLANGLSNCAGGGFVSLGHNLYSDNGCGLIRPGDLTNTDPQLGPLQDNGGSTETHGLLATSPAIDAGDDSGCPATDQRGVARPQGAACDIGAYEVPSHACVGDCSGDARVTVDEILILENIALRNGAVTPCLPGDANADNEITIDEILAAVDTALNGCGAF